MNLRRGLVLLAGLAASAPLLAVTPGAGAAPEDDATCRGVPATIVGAGELVGTPGDDVIVATRPSTKVRAGKGDDLVCGSRLVRGQAGDDRIHYAGRATTRDSLHIVGGAGSDVIRFHGEQDFPAMGTREGVYGGPGADLMVGAGGALWFSGGWGDDRLISGPGGDLLDGDGGDDVLLGGSGQEIMSGGRGDDELRGRAHSDDLSGGPGRDEVWGGPDWDVCARGNEIEHSCESDTWV